MPGEAVSLKVDDGTAAVTLTRPERMNCLDAETAAALFVALKDAERQNAKVIIITGSGKAFCSGGDVKAMGEAKNPERFLMELVKPIHDVVLAVRRSPALVLAAVNGVATGAGCSLVLACDLKVLSTEARLSMWFAGIGLAPGCGTELLVEHVGRARASEMLLAGKRLGASEALEWGIANWVVPPDDLMPFARKKASELSVNALLAITRTKALLNHAKDNTLEEQLALERHFISISGATEDFREGTGAFAEKRKPSFKGR
ncbi:MAG: enoyl-CoA hydratase-related protein [Methanobacteriota archaeon]